MQVIFENVTEEPRNAVASTDRLSDVHRIERDGHKLVHWNGRLYVVPVESNAIQDPKCT